MEIWVVRAVKVDHVGLPLCGNGRWKRLSTTETQQGFVSALEALEENSVSTVVCAI